MKSFIAMIAAVSAVASAAPMASFKNYKFQTQVIAGNMDFNNQYVEAYHTGAGFNAAALTKTGGTVGYVNTTSTEVEFNLGNDFIVNLGLGAPDSYYAAWGPVTLNEGALETETIKGFSVGPQGYLTHLKGNDQSFTGWRVCNWVYGVPQLFWNTNVDPGNKDIPTSCATVYLKAIPA